jgi:isocitrate dehydrogenase
MKTEATIIWTFTDEAPALATFSLLPVVQAFTKGTGISVTSRDISLAGRIVANFPEKLTPAQKIPDYLAQLGELTQSPEANIIKLPNISASIPQLKAAIKELRDHGYDLPDYPESPKNDAEKAIQERYGRVLGSAVNPVLREGNSDRRSPLSVKNFSKKHPHKLGAWKPESKTHVSHMSAGDFYASEISTVVRKPTEVRFEFVGQDGKTTVLKKSLRLEKDEILDCSTMNVAALRSFYEKEIQDCQAKGLLLSLHLKATMMKVSDPVMFGHAVSVYFKDVFEKHAATFKQVGVDPNMGLGDLYSKIAKLDPAKKAEIEADIKATYAKRPPLAMVDSDKGITNLHQPNDIIIDASMPPMIRDSGGMWGPDGKLRDTKALIPDRCYATPYKAIVEDCVKNGALNPATMGSVPNVGLMARKAEEYGSHDKTFMAPAAGTIRIVTTNDEVLLEQKVGPGDIFRACETQDVAVKDWVQLALRRGRASGAPAVFWLDKNRAHDAQIIARVESCLKESDTKGVEVRIMPPVEAMKFSLERIRKGQDTISVTGNVLRDYLTDLFPILEIGTSAKMLSIAPLLAGGALFETGAGGSAPKHVQQFQKEGYLRWDSLGEFSAFAASLEHVAGLTKNPKAAVLGEALDAAIGKFLENNKSPARKVGEIDNRGSHYYLAMYWAEALAAQSRDQDLRNRFTVVAKKLAENETKINGELIGAQGKPIDMGGYYHPDPKKVEPAMRPSQTLNAIINSIA